MKRAKKLQILGLAVLWGAFSVLFGSFGLISDSFAQQLINGEVNCAPGGHAVVYEGRCGIGILGYEIAGVSGDSLENATFEIACPGADINNCKDGKATWKYGSEPNWYKIQCVNALVCQQEDRDVLIARARVLEVQIATNEGKMEELQTSLASMGLISKGFDDKTGLGFDLGILENFPGAKDKHAALKSLEKQNKEHQAELDGILNQLYGVGDTPEIQNPIYNGGNKFIDPVPVTPARGETWLDGFGLIGGITRLRRTLDPEIGTTTDLPSLIIAWLDFIFNIVALGAVLAIIYAGFLFIFYYGDDERRGQAVKIILYVIIGIVIVFSAYAIVRTIINGVSN